VPVRRESGGSNEARQAFPVVFFGNDWEAENRTSSHHLSRWLAARHPLLYVECPGLRTPTTGARDLRKTVRVLWAGLRGPVPTGEGPLRWTLIQLPFHGSGLARRINQVMGRALLRFHLRRLGFRNSVFWFTVPHAGHLAGGLGEALTVYYCIDDYAALPHVDREAVTVMDRELTARADLVFVASDTLLEGKRAINPRTVVSPHGVDVAHFATARSPDLAVPPDLQALPGPVIGFFGLIEEWIDLDLVAYLADSRPHWSFAMIGRLAVPADRVPRRANIHFLGRRPYQALPACGKAFAAAIIPYRLTRQVLHANPIKLREYLAMGLPVVSVRTPEISKFEGVVHIAETREEFLAALDRVLAAPEPAGEAERRMSVTRGMSWDARLREVEATVIAALRGGLVPRAAAGGGPPPRLKEQVP
jgi:glycosyltransferase involved in cell wall biosynthesis